MRKRWFLACYPNELNETDEKHPKKKEKVLSGIKKEMMRNYAFQHLSRHAGKGQRNSIKRLHEANNNDEIVETCVERSKIENELMKYDKIHFTQAHRTIAYDDKTHEKLRMDNVRNKTLKGNIQRHYCDNENMCRFLKLLKQPKGRNHYKSTETMSIDQ